MTSILDIKGLNRSYPGFRLQDIDLCLQPGSTLALIGPNGAGKTTLLKLVMGQTAPLSGEIKVCGLSHQTDFKEIRNRIGYVPEEQPFQPSFRARDVISLGARFYNNWDSPRFIDLLDQFAIDPGQQVKNLSRGRKSLLSLAMALSHKADLLLLDEPAAGLDAQGRRKVLRLMAEFTAEEDKAVVISTHQTEGLAPLADRVAFLHEGNLVLENETDDLLANWKWVHYRSGAVDPDLEQLLACRESGSFGNRGLLSAFPEHRQSLESSEAAGELHVTPATIDDVLISLTEGK